MRSRGRLDSPVIALCLEDQRSLQCWAQPLVLDDGAGVDLGEPVVALIAKAVAPSHDGNAKRTMPSELPASQPENMPCLSIDKLPIGKRWQHKYIEHNSAELSRRMGHVSRIHAVRRDVR